ncbi:hypothetical protein BH23BAC2_BH23BAC2_20720 [soil metagenome]
MMKKLSLILLASVFTLSIYSCRETTEERTEDTLEEVGNDIETTTEDAYDNTETEINEEIEGTDDLNADDDLQ